METKPVVLTNEQQQMGLELSTHLVKQIVEKNYLTTLNELAPIPLNKNDFLKTIPNIRMYKVDEIVYTAKENIFQKLTNVFNALAVHKSSIFLLIDAEVDHVSLYLGVRQVDTENSIVTSAETLRKAIQGQFPGTRLTNITNPKIRKLQERLNQYQSIAVASGIPELKSNEVGQNEHFVQGIEKFIDTMQGEQYQTIILAENLTKDEVVDIRTQYENIYSSLSSMKKLTLNVSEGSSVGSSEGKSESVTEGTSESSGHSYSLSDSEGISSSNSRSRPTEAAVKAAKRANTLKAVGALIDTGIFAATSIFSGGKNTIFTSAASALMGRVETKSDMASRETQSTTEGTSQSHTTSEGTTQTKGTSHSTTNGRTTSQSTNTSQNKAVTQEFENKTIVNMLKRLDQQFERIDDFADTSAWQTAAYFLSDQPDAAEIAGATYQSIMSGENTGVQVSTVNSWHADADTSTQNSVDERQIRDYVANFLHPQFVFNDITNVPMKVEPTSIISSEELGLALSLPRQSVSGVPVIEQVKFAKSISAYHGVDSDRQIQLGKIAPGRPDNPRDFEPAVSIDIPSLASHAFITGSTGTGKSNTVYAILGQLLQKNIKFCVIEPAKGEYKNVFGNRPDVNVYGTNSWYTPLLRINPFAFPQGIHIFEHIDRLIEIFNVSWPMYAAMPAILKDAVILAYQKVGWNLETSTNKNGNHCFPSFTDLIQCLKQTIDQSDYSNETKGDYAGSLITRVKSLTNGLNGLILTENEISMEKLFDENTIIDLSRIGSTETKSLLMGFLVMRLNEYRMDTATEMNQPLKHVTVLEEAHNILGSADNAGPEGAGMQQKSVQMLTSAIAEMRTYGEGFMIVDQSPSAVDIAAIKNTNTKIIMRMPEENDRKLVGKAAAMTNEQLKELALLHKGEAVIYQNDWLEPALVNIMNARQTGIDVDGSYHLDLSVSEIAEVLKRMVYNFVKHPEFPNDDVFAELEKKSFFTAPEKSYLHELRDVEHIVRPDLKLLAKVLQIDSLDSYRERVHDLYPQILNRCQNVMLTKESIALIERSL